MRMKLDLHVHASEYSSCAIATMEEQIRAAITVGLSGIVFTNHHRLVPAQQLRELNDVYAPFMIFGGIEITVREGEDILVYGVDDPAIESIEWDYPRLHAFVRQRGGYMVIAHPFRYRQGVNLELEAYPADAIELRSSNIGPENELKIRKLAKQHKMRLMCNSDAHSTDKIGLHYNLFRRVPPHIEELIDFLRSCEFSGIVK